MKKLVMLLGVASLLAASPVLAATKTMKPMHTTQAAMCTEHGKKVPCSKHKATHKKTHKKTHKAVSKPKAKAKY